MTTYLPLDLDAEFPSSPPFLLPSANPDSQLRQIIQRILKAKRIVVLCGAGISVASGIPDFRSAEGLFNSLGKQTKGGITSGRDLFDASVFGSERTTAMFCEMIARLADLSVTASPSPFHQTLKLLDDRTRLLRVYTQNIDMLELKSGLSFGVPELLRKPQARSRKKGIDFPRQDTQEGSPRKSTPPTFIPRCIPLHGTLDILHCTNSACKSTFPLESHHDSFSRGELPLCAVCLDTESTRELVGKRPRGVGKLRPSIVLYNEDHNKAEDIGEATRRDLVGSSSRSGPDLLLVVGTSLKVPGTKRIVREFSKSVRHNRANKQAAQIATPLSSPRRTPAGEDQESTPINSIYVNLDFPVPTREWRDVFDVWIQGDAQRFAALLNDEMAQEPSGAKNQVPARQSSATNTPSHDRQVQVPKDAPKRQQPRTPDSPSSHTKRRKLSCVHHPGTSSSSPNLPLPKLYIRIPARPHSRSDSSASIDQKHPRSLSMLTPPPSPPPSHVPGAKRRLADLLLADDAACASAFQTYRRS
ncbi:DHS-like NAD/FAD-binding domain-containing protein [Pterulicium gracile]|uniref:DHS-like NAD/FAD-binding domain-containing protein n=1 Tax=Pterulicium gracile TaxID=1884261 RepID=A0A5C3QQA5_9AGAR|nr:DHS-like NAD/FAD-binding domain-containing protein [Pterula gracilis]